jgi:hypothetical protein
MRRQVVPVTATGGPAPLRGPDALGGVRKRELPTTAPSPTVPLP